MKSLYCCMTDTKSTHSPKRTLLWSMFFWLILTCTFVLTSVTSSAAVPTGAKAQTLLAKLGHSHWIGQGRGPHILYLIFDPNCPYCHALIDQLQPLIPEFGLQVRYVVVGFLAPSSVGKAAYILQAKNPLAAILTNEHKFNMKHFGGVPAIHPDQKTKQILAQNLALLSETGAKIVPAEIFKRNSGTIQIHHGNFNAFKIDSILQSIAN